MLGNKEDELRQDEEEGFSTGRESALSSGALWEARGMGTEIYTHYIAVTVCVMSGSKQSLACKASWRLPL